MTRKKILCVGGSLNQTTQVYQVAQYLEPEYECWFSAAFVDGFMDILVRMGIGDFTVLGGIGRRQTEEFLAEKGVPVDYQGKKNDYDLVVLTSDLYVPRVVKPKKIVLIQEGMTDPEGIMYHLVTKLKLPRYLASTSTNGLSNEYDAFCVASQGYKELFADRGADLNRMYVTGIPNYDNAATYLKNDFPYHGYVMVATSDARETLKYDNRKKFLRQAVEIADGRPMIFKLHPNENAKRAKREIREFAPHAQVYTEGNTHEMIANCDVLITQYSTVVYTGIALDKEVHSYFNVDELYRLAPWQNGGKSARHIADICRRLMDNELAHPDQVSFEREAVSERRMPVAEAR